MTDDTGKMPIDKVLAIKDVRCGLTAVEDYCDDQGWDMTAIKVAELRREISSLLDCTETYDCTECPHRGAMNTPGQTMDMPVVTQCPACGETGDHPRVEEGDDE